MIGKIVAGKKKVAIVGGGVSGLLAARKALSNGNEVSLFESSARLGGLIQTHRLPLGMAETAAHSLLATPAVQELFSNLQVPLSPARKVAKKRWIWRGERMTRFPLTFREFPQTLGHLLWGRLNGDVRSLTWEDFGNSLLSSSVTDYLLNPALRGIYAARPSEISLATLLNQSTSFQSASLRDVLKSVQKKDRGAICAPSEGMGSFIEGLQRDCEKRGLQVFFNQTVKSASELSTFDQVVVSTPASQAADLFREVSHKVSELLSQISYAPLVTVTLITRKQLPKYRKGIGLLFPEKEGAPVLGILMNSVAFPGRVANENEFESFTVLLGGTSDPIAFQKSDADLLDRAKAGLALLLEAAPELMEFEITRWPRAIPIYSPHHFEILQGLHSWVAEQSRWVFFGNYTGQVSLRGMIEASK